VRHVLSLLQLWQQHGLFVIAWWVEPRLVAARPTGQAVGIGGLFKFWSRTDERPAFSSMGPAVSEPLLESRLEAALDAKIPPECGTPTEDEAALR
jgi:hypothetical protein